MAQNPSIPWVPTQGPAARDGRNDLPQRQRLHAVFSAFRDSGAGSGLALDVLLHELAGEAQDVIHSSSAAIAWRDSDNHFVCRAVSGETAPRVGTRIEAQDGLSAECVRSGQLQICQDSETDGRVDAEMCQALGMRSFVIVPLFLEQRLMGILEVFSPDPRAFDRSALERLIDIGYRIVETIAFAEAEVRPQPPSAAERVLAPVRPWVEVALPERAHEVPAAVVAPVVTRPMPLQEAAPNESTVESGPVLLLPPRSHRNLGLALIALVAGLVATSGLLWWPSTDDQQTAVESDGSRQTGIPAAVAAATGSSVPANSSRQAKPPAGLKAQPVTPRLAGADTGATTAARSGSLVVYEKGKVVYRALPGSGEIVGPGTGPVTSAAETEKLHDTADVAAPVISGGKLIHQVEPVVPSGLGDIQLPEEVVLEGIVGRDGMVRDIRFIRGDSRLFGAAIDAVRQWRYEPFLANGEPVDMLSTLSVRFR